MTTRVTTGIIASALLLACSDPLNVEKLAGTYSLTEMDALALPQLLSATLECDEWVEAGELTLEGNGGFLLAVRGELDCSRGGGQLQAVGWEYPGTYTLAGTTLAFVSPLFPAGELHFTGIVDPSSKRILVKDLMLDLSHAVDLEFRQ